MPGIRLVLHSETGKYQGVAWVLKYKGHILVYDPQTNGVGWVAMRGIPSLLTEVELWSASNLGNSYPIPCASPAGPTPHGEMRVKYTQTGTQPSKPPAGDFDKYVDWDTDDVQDWLRTPSPVTIVDELTLGAVEETPPARQNRCLVPERILEADAEPHLEDTPDEEEKETQGHTPRKEQSAPVAEDDVVVLYVGAEEL